MKDLAKKYEKIGAPFRLEVNKTNIEVWRNLSRNAKSNKLKYQNLQNLILKSQNLTCNLIDALYKATKVTDPRKLQDIIKHSLRRCANPTMVLGKMNHHLH